MEVECVPREGKRRKFEVEENCDLSLVLPSSSAASEMKTELFLQDYFHFGGDGRKTAVVFDNGKGLVEELSYEELNLGADFVRRTLEKIFSGDEGEEGGAQEFVGVNCDLGILYPVVVLGILRSGHAFYNIDPSCVEGSVRNGVDLLGMKCILSGGGDRSNLGEKWEVETVKLGIGENKTLSLQVHKLIDSYKAPKVPPFKYAYAIQTSGTTGLKKTVLVPHTCICPNIADFAGAHWKMTGNDVIFGSAPPTFDPHMVELFSALAVGATILYTPPEVKINASLLTNLLATYNVSVLQITPSLFRRLCSRDPSNLKNLRLIAFGGEKCPEKKELREAISTFFNKNITLQNVYGVTEVSCWASVANIDLTSEEPITIGKALTGTEITLTCDPEGEIVIGSRTRGCVILDPSNSAQVPACTPPFLHVTGDLGVMTPAGIVFQGRRDRVVKRNGMKISLSQVEVVALSTGLASFAECKLHQGKIYLVVKLKEDIGGQGTDLFTDKLEVPLFMYPDFIIALNQNNIPLNSNGKIDMDGVIKNFLLSCSSDASFSVKVTSGQIEETLTPIWKSCTNCAPRENILEEIFTAARGTSISAARFVESCFMSLRMFGSAAHRTWERKLLRDLLDEEQGTFGGVVDTIFKIISETPAVMTTQVSKMKADLLPETQQVLPRQVTVTPSLEEFEFQFLDHPDQQDDNLQIFNPVEEFPSPSTLLLQSPPEPVETYTFPLSLCVDASPTIIPSKNQAIIGCHGGVLLCLDLNVLRLHPKSPSRAVSWRRKFPSRIEASVEISPNSLFCYVGCHDGHLYKLSATTGDIICWTTSDQDATPIRSKCTVSNDLVIFIASNAIVCVDAYNLNTIWKVTSFQLLATMSPVLFRGKCLLATLNQGIVSLDTKSGHILWNTPNPSTGVIYSPPILITFQSPLKRRNVTYLVSTSNQGIEARDPKSGTLSWRHTSSSPSPRFIPPLYNECCDNLIWIDNLSQNSSHLKILNPETGQILGDLRISHDAPINPCLVFCHDKKCYIFYKSSKTTDIDQMTSPQLTFISLHEVMSFSNNQDLENQTVKHWKMATKCNFQTFSKPQISSEIILFGGRDNNLHVVKMKV